MPKRNSRHGSAKYSTKALRPGIAASGSTRRQAARYPARTSAKKGIVTARMAGMGAEYGKAARCHGRSNALHELSTSCDNLRGFVFSVEGHHGFISVRPGRTLLRWSMEGARY